MVLIENKKRDIGKKLKAKQKDVGKKLKAKQRDIGKKLKTNKDMLERIGKNEIYEWQELKKK